jgi:hypothetical protein
MYTARIAGLKPVMTAAMFQGEGAEEVCLNVHRMFTISLCCNSNAERRYPDTLMFGADIQGNNLLI